MQGAADRFFAWRNKIIADPRFHDWAARFVLTRPIVRRRAGDLFDLCAGFVYTQALTACVRLNWFEALRDGPLSVDALARRSDLTADAARRLARAAAALDLLQARGTDRFGLGQRGAALLGSPSVFSMIRHHAALYEDLRDPVALLRREGGPTALSTFWGYAESDRPEALPGEETEGYSALMAATQTFIAEEVMRSFSFTPYARVLDVGCGDGAFLAAVRRGAPRIDLVGFDLPSVADRARARWAEKAAAASEPAGGRTEFVGGDFRRDSLPGGADLVTLVRILHDHDDAPAAALLRAARRAMAPGARLMIAEPMAGTPGARAMGDAYFGFYLWAMGSGRPRRPRELKAMLRSAGFTRVKRVRTAVPVLTQILVADVDENASI
ncbi:MAG: methyltransferase [Pseudomonadota bacterium]